MHVLNIDTRGTEEAANGPAYLVHNWQGHGQQVAAFARDIALELGLSDGAAARVEKAARFHDIGKSRLPDCFDGTENKPEELSQPERELLMSHTWLGYRILQNEPNLDSWVSETALLHHEWWNGNGYPLGLARSDIPLVARIVTVADAYSTFIEQRPYPGQWHADAALAGVRDGTGVRFDPECVEALASVIGRSRPAVPGEPFTVHTTSN